MIRVNAVRCLLLVSWLLSGCATSPSAADEPARDVVTMATEASYSDWVEYLRLPNVTRRSVEEIQTVAHWTTAKFAAYGFTTQLLEDGDTPMVYAAWPDVVATRPTVLFYAHMDGQPVFPERWDQADPFEPVLKRKSGDGWEPIEIELLLSGAALPDDRLFARSAADDKAPIMMMLAAMNALTASGLDPAINIKMLLDSHEEGGKGTLPDVVERYADLLAADAIVMLDGPMHATNRPTVVFGHRGGAGFELTVFGARSELHSGHYGNYAPNAAQMLAELLATFKDSCGRVVVEGFYDGVEFDNSMKSAFSDVPDDEDGLRDRLGIAQADCVGENYQEAINHPSFNIAGLRAAGVGPERRTIIPDRAIAAIGMRTVPQAPPEQLLSSVRAHIEKQGFHLVDGEPTEDERRKYPRLASMTGGRGSKALQTPLDSPLGTWVTTSLTETFGEAPVRIPLMGGTVPTSGLLSLGAPIILLPLVNNDNNQHAPNENMRIGNYGSGVRALYGLFQTEMKVGSNSAPD